MENAHFTFPVYSILIETKSQENNQDGWLKSKRWDCRMATLPRQHPSVQRDLTSCVSSLCSRIAFSVSSRNSSNRKTEVRTNTEIRTRIISKKALTGTDQPPDVRNITNTLDTRDTLEMCGRIGNTIDVFSDKDALDLDGARR